MGKIIEADKILIRDAVIEDLKAIVDIYNSTVPGRMVTADTEPVAVESRISWFHAHNPETRPLLVMEYDGNICGWLSFQSFYGRPAYNATVEVSIYIDERYRGNGLGRYLLQKAIELCPRYKVKTVLAFVFGHNNPSMKLFKSFGFGEWGNYPKIAELDGIERDLIILGKRVG